MAKCWTCNGAGGKRHGAVHANVSDCIETLQTERDRYKAALEAIRKRYDETPELRYDPELGRLIRHALDES